MDQHQHVYGAESRLSPSNSGKLPRYFKFSMVQKVFQIERIKIKVNTRKTFRHIQMLMLVLKRMKSVCGSTSDAITSRKPPDKRRQKQISTAFEKILLTICFIRYIQHSETKFILKQECIPVGCVPPAAVAVCRGGLPQCMLGYPPGCGPGDPP